MERLSQTVIYFVTAHILGADVFGVAALATTPAIVVITAIQTIPQFVVSRTEADEPMLSSSFWATMGLSVLTALLIAVFSHPLASYMQIESSSTLILASSIGVLLAGVGTTSEAIIIRSLNFRLMAIRRIFGVIAAGAVAIALAHAGAGPWAIVAQLIIASGVTSLVCLVGAKWFPSTAPNARDLKAYFRFCTPVVGTSLVNMVTIRAVEVAAGIIGGPAAAGVLRMAKSIIDLVGSLTLSPVTSLLLPLLARINETTRRVVFFDRATSILTVVIGAATVAMLPSVRFIYLILPESQWNGLAEAIALFSIGLPATGLLSAVMELFVVSERPAIPLYANVLQLVISIGLTVILAHYGPAAVAAGGSARLYISLAIIHVIWLVPLLRSADNTRLSCYAPLWVALVVSVAWQVLSTLFFPALPYLAQVASSLLLIAIFGGVLFAFDKRALVDTVETLKHRRAP